MHKSSTQYTLQVDGMGVITLTPVEEKKGMIQSLLDIPRKKKTFVPQVEAPHKTIYMRLKNFIDKNDIKLSRASKEAGYSDTYLNTIVRGVKNGTRCSPNVIKRICLIFNASGYECTPGDFSSII